MTSSVSDNMAAVIRMNQACPAGNWEFHPQLKKVATPGFAEKLDAEAFQKVVCENLGIPTRDISIVFSNSNKNWRVVIESSKVPAEFSNELIVKLRDTLDRANKEKMQSAQQKVMDARAHVDQAGQFVPIAEAAFQAVKQYEPRAYITPNEEEKLKDFISKEIGPNVLKGCQSIEVGMDELSIMFSSDVDTESIASKYSASSYTDDSIIFRWSNLNGIEEVIPQFFATIEQAKGTEQAQQFYRNEESHYQAIHDLISAQKELREATSAESTLRYGLLGQRTSREVNLSYDADVPSRYEKDIPCPLETRVETPDSVVKVHANNVTVGGVRTICAQAPLEKNQEGFWLVAMSNTNLILDLTNKADRVNNLERYFPSMTEGDKSVFEKGSVTIRCVQKEKDDRGTLKTSVYHAKSGDQENTITRGHYQGWPDHGAVSPEELTTLVNYVRSNGNIIGDKPVLIHCSAGVGRTGTVVVALALAEMSRKGELNIENVATMVDDLIIEGRQQRGPSFVQSQVQYGLLLEFGRQLAENKIELT